MIERTSPLKDRAVLVVDDEPDVLDTVEQELDICMVYKASDYDTAVQYILGFTYDIVILDIMGVNGFELLKLSVERGFPTVMLTAHALTPEALEKSIKLGAVFFLPKEKMTDLREFLEDVVLGGGQPIWKKVFDRFGNLFARHFGPDWKERHRFLEEFEKTLKKNENASQKI